MLIISSKQLAFNYCKLGLQLTYFMLESFKNIKSKIILQVGIWSEIFHTTVRDVYLFIYFV